MSALQFSFLSDASCEVHPNDLRVSRVVYDLLPVILANELEIAILDIIIYHS